MRVPLILMGCVTCSAMLAGGSPAHAQPTPIKAPIAGATSGTWQYLKLSDNFLYDLLLPYGYSSSHTYPVVLYLHGDSTEAPQGTPPYTAFPALINSTSVQGVNYRANYPAIIVAPQCSNSAYGSNDWGGTHTTIKNNHPVNTNMPCGVNALRALTSVMNTYSADPTRIYITGYSLGGIGTWYLYTTHTKLFAAAIPIAGNISGGATPASFESLLLKKPLWAFHGFNDTVISKAWDEQTYTLSNQSGGIMKYTEFVVKGDVTTYPSELEPQNGDGHGNADTSAYVNSSTLTWLFAQSLPAPPNSPALKHLPIDHGL